jgi:succinoglycan biosynthesis protein ExoM
VAGNRGLRRALTGSAVLSKLKAAVAQEVPGWRPAHHDGSARRAPAQSELPSAPGALSRPNPGFITNPDAATPRISVCIATFRRPRRLQLLLEDLSRQSLPPRQIVVVDNDRQGSARGTVDAFVREHKSASLAYEIQPLRGIALTRNRTVALAAGDWMAFIDDDERAPPDWLQLLMTAIETQAADGIIAPVLPQLPENAAPWLKRGSFYDFPRMRTGTTVPKNYLRFGNAILRSSLVRAEPGPFDPHYELRAGEDGDMLLRLLDRGARIVWCDEAVVYEPVEASRLSLRWLLQRAYSRGQEFARKRLAGRYGRMTFARRLLFFGDCAAKLCIAATLSLVTFPLGRHRAASWLVRGAANIGKLTAFLGWHYQEYERASASVLQS